MGVIRRSEIASSKTYKNMQNRVHYQVEGFSTSNRILRAPSASILVGGLCHCVFEVNVGTDIETNLAIRNTWGYC